MLDLQHKCGVMVLFDHIEWDEANIAHATRHGVATWEVEEAIVNADMVRRNRRNRSGDVRFDTKTDAGRQVVVIAAYDADWHAVRPITAWEKR